MSCKMFAASKYHVAVTITGALEELWATSSGGPSSTFSAGFRVSKWDLLEL
jgi:hypothetical protein